MAISGRFLRRILVAAGLSGGLLAAGLICWGQTEPRRKAPPEPPKLGNLDWPVYRGDPKGNQFVAIAQINATNVHKLRPAWEYHTGDASERSTMYANPLVINGVMYISTPSLKAVALDAATGRASGLRPGQLQQRRGHPAAQPRRDVLEGHRGRADLRLRRRPGLRRRCEVGRTDSVLRQATAISTSARTSASTRRASTLEMTTPGAVYKNLLILGSRVNETYGASPGHIRAYDTVTGAVEVDLSHDPATGRVRSRHLVVAHRGDLRRRERVGRRHHRRAARLGLRRNRVGHGRLLWRLPQGQEICFPTASWRWTRTPAS